MKRSPILAILILTIIVMVGCQNNSSTNAGEKEVNSTVVFSESKTETKPDETETVTACEETEETTQATESTTQKATEKVKVEPTTKSVQTEKATQPEPTEKATQKPAPKPTEKPTQKATQKPTQAPTKPKATQPKATQPPKQKIDTAQVINSGIAYGKSKGMTYDSSLNTGNASWFPPSVLTDFPTTSELTQACYQKIDYMLSYWKGQGYKAKDFSFNVIITGGKLYLVYS